jgi:hypothetical protein
MPSIMPNNQSIQTAVYNIVAEDSSPHFGRKHERCESFSSRWWCISCYPYGPRYANRHDQTI